MGKISLALLIFLAGLNGCKTSSSGANVATSGVNRFQCRGESSTLDLGFLLKIPELNLAEIKSRLDKSGSVLLVNRNTLRTIGLPSQVHVDLSVHKVFDDDVGSRPTSTPRVILTSIPAKLSFLENQDDSHVGIQLSFNGGTMKLQYISQQQREKNLSYYEKGTYGSEWPVVDLHMNQQQTDFGVKWQDAPFACFY